MLSRNRKTLEALSVVVDTECCNGGGVITSYSHLFLLLSFLLIHHFMLV